MFRIGDFSRLARVTVRTLHHYDEEDLLPAAYVDPATGYRYYSAAQLETLQRIALLKDLGFPLATIRGLLGAKQPDAEEFSKLLSRRRQELAASVAADQLRLRRLDALLEEISARGSVDAPAVVLRELAGIEVYSVRARVPHLGDCVQAMFEAAEAAVAGARADASPLLIFHDVEYVEEQADVEVCIPVKTPRPVQLATRVLPAVARAGCVTYRGPYQQTPGLYQAMSRWIERSGFAIAGPLREVYHRFGADQSGYRLPQHMLAADSADYVTELQVPVATATTNE
jgi:DNA-binding transcriptional MerR regulator/effector-binding domain-containing protein